MFQTNLSFLLGIKGRFDIKFKYVEWESYNWSKEKFCSNPEAYEEKRKIIVKENSQEFLVADLKKVIQ